MNMILFPITVTVSKLPLDNMSEHSDSVLSEKDHKLSF